MRLCYFLGFYNPILYAIVITTIVAIKIDDYVFEVLMRDLVGHDRSPSAFLVYLHLWHQTIGRQEKSARLSHQTIANATGLSKSAVQTGMRRLLRRHLVRIHRDSVTAVPEYLIARPWLNR
jgi:hypothetical protein